jgi:hypothetical protein
MKMSNAIDAPITLDVLISDIDSSDLHERVSQQLNKKYLSDTTQELDDVEGMLFGDFYRLVGTMTLNIKGKIKNVHFLVDTGSPRTYICNEVLKSYNLFLGNPNDPFMVRLNKRRIAVKVSSDRFEDLNLLGTDFLYTNNARLFVDFEEKRFTIKFNTSDSIDSSERIPERGDCSPVLDNKHLLFFFIFLFLLMIVIVLKGFWNRRKKTLEGLKKEGGVLVIVLGDRHMMRRKRSFLKLFGIYLLILLFNL